MLVVDQVTIEGYLTALLYDNGVVEIVWDKSTVESIEPIHIKKMKEAVAQLGGGQKMPLFFTAHEFLAVSKEGGKYAASVEGTEYSLASAVLVDNLAKRMLLNFFVNFNKPTAPTKGFTSRNQAFKWLEKMAEAVPVNQSE